MSPRAACRLERIGFPTVYDYVLGIADWRGAGLPVEGEDVQTQTVGDALLSDFPTCEPGDRLGDVRARTFDAGRDECIVVDCGGLVAGRLRAPIWEGDPDAMVESVMEPGPTTVRPDVALSPLVERMRKQATTLVVVATPQGELVGVLLRDDAERVVTGEPLSD